MRQREFVRLLGGAVLLASVASAKGVLKAQVDCETIPEGPARTDCYIGLSRINRQKSEIAAGAAQQQTDRAIYRQLTGRRPNTKWHHRAAPGR
jgi:hypothetical protein